MRATAGLHLDLGFTGSVDALAALNDGRCLIAGFHALTSAPLGSPTALVYRPMLRPGRHKLIGFASRSQGLIVAAGNPLAIRSLRDLADPRIRFVNRARGTGTRVVLDELLAAAGISSDDIAGYERVEPSHRAVAQLVVERRRRRRVRHRGGRARPGASTLSSSRASAISWPRSPPASTIRSSRRCVTR